MAHQDFGFRRCGLLHLGKPPHAKPEPHAADGDLGLIGLLVKSDHTIGCDSCEGLWGIEELLRIIYNSRSAAPLREAEVA